MSKGNGPGKRRQASRQGRPALPHGRSTTIVTDTPATPISDPAEKLTIAEVIADLKISRSTFYYWRQLGKAPHCTKLPNGEIRILRGDYDAWYKTHMEAA